MILRESSWKKLLNLCAWGSFVMVQRGALEVQLTSLTRCSQWKRSDMSSAVEYLRIERRAKFILNKQANLQNMQMHKTRVYRRAQDLTGEHSEKWLFIIVSIPTYTDEYSLILRLATLQHAPVERQVFLVTGGLH